jgi:hypothetical protein
LRRRRLGGRPSLRLYRVEEGGGLKELGIELWISKVVSGAALQKATSHRTTEPGGAHTKNF